MADWLGGDTVIIRLTQSSWAGAGTELGNIDDLVIVLKVFWNNQKTQLARINELEKKVEYLEKDSETEKKETDKRFDKAI